MVELIAELWVTNVLNRIRDIIPWFSLLLSLASLWKGRIQVLKYCGALLCIDVCCWKLGFENKYFPQKRGCAREGWEPACCWARRYWYECKPQESWVRAGGSLSNWNIWKLYPAAGAVGFWCSKVLSSQLLIPRSSLVICSLQKNKLTCFNIY